MINDEKLSVWHSRRALMVAALCMIILALVGIGVTAVFIVDQRQYTDCQREYNEDTQTAIRERGAAGSLDRQAIYVISSSTFAMIEILLMPGSTVDQKKAAIESWRDSQGRANAMISDANEQREAHPIPEPRNC